MKLEAPAFRHGEESLLEVTDAVIEVWGAGRVGMHLAPRCDAHTMGDSNPLATFGYVAEELGKRKIAFIVTREHSGEDSLSLVLKQRFGGFFIANEGFDADSAQSLLAAGGADAVAFGKAMIANPDLPRRMQENVPLNPPNFQTFYGVGLADPAAGYTDYPFAD